MIKAYILLTLSQCETSAIFENLKQLPHIESIAVVAGIYDVVIKVKVETLDQLYDLTYTNFSRIPGIKEMTTFIVEKEIIPEED